MKDTSSGFDIHMIGIIVLVVGIVWLVASLARGTMVGFRSVRESHVSGDGRTVVEREQTNATQPRQSYVAAAVCCRSLTGIVHLCHRFATE